MTLIQLPTRQAKTLSAVARYEPIEGSRLVRLLHRHGVGHQIVDALEALRKAGLVKRNRAERDRRRNQWPNPYLYRLTVKGRKVIETK